MSINEQVLRNEDASDSSDEAEVEIALVLERYLADLEAGRLVDPDRLIAEHPDLAGPLRACLEVMGLPLESPDSSAHSGSSGLTSCWESDDTLPRVLLSEPASDEHAPVLTRPGLPVHAGRYQILGEIARGVMGAVLRARDADLGRELALKILLRPHRDDADLRNRFVEEAQIGGQLQHPGIVPVYELGAFPDRRPFLAMKLVRGRTLSALLAERPDPTHDLSRFLTIFEQVCQTVAYAHSRRVIHRDLKPSNVMVGSFGEVQVMDWGLAKVLPEGGVADERKRPDIVEAVTQVRTLRTEGSGSESQAGSVLGTPAYMSPEQARGEIDRVDERADVFGLGAILCEILTGRPPFVGSTRGEIQAMAARGDLAEASTRLDACGSHEELTRLARDCMAPRPSDRPRDASAVARRMTAYTAGAQERLRAAELARAEAQARVVEERKRRKLVVGLALSLIGLILTVGGGGVWWAFDRQARAGRVDVAIHGVRVLLDEAEREGDDLAKWSVARETAGHLRPLLAEARDTATRSHAESLIETVERGMADATADRKLLDEIVAIEADAVDDMAEETDTRYADAFHARGIESDVKEPSAAAVVIAGRPPRVALSLAYSLDNWSSVRRGRGDRKGAERLTRVAGQADRDTWRSGLRAAAGGLDPGARRVALREFARKPADDMPTVNVVMLGSFLLDSGDAVGAEEVLRKGRSRDPGNARLNSLLARSIKRLGRAEESIRYYMAAQTALPMSGHELAHALQDKGETDAAVNVFRDLIRRRPEVPKNYTCLGQALNSRGRTRESAEAFKAAVAASRQRVRMQPGSASAHVQFGFNLFMMDLQGNVEAAIAEYREAIRLNPDLAGAHHALAIALHHKGDHDAAGAELREAIRLQPDYADAHSDLGLVLLAQGEVDAAIAKHREAIGFQPDSDVAHYSLALALRSKGEVHAAIAELREAIRLKSDIADAHNVLGTLLREQGEIDPAIVEFREEIRLRPDYPNAHNNLGTALEVKGQGEAAIIEFRTAIRLNPDYPLAHFNLGLSLKDKGMIDEAITSIRQAIRARPDYAEAYLCLANISLEKGDVSAAIAAYREAIRLKPDYAEAHYNLGNAWNAAGNIEAAIAEYREAIRFNPEHAEAVCNLGIRMGEQGRYREAVELLERGHELGSRRPGWRYPSQEWVQQHRRLLDLETRLPAILKGEAKPGNASERLELVAICYRQGLQAASARFAGEAFAENPALAEDLQTGARYNAACSASLAGSGRGKDDPMPDEAARARLREQALGWLKADLELWAGILKGGNEPDRKQAVAQTLAHWKEDPDLAGIHDEASLAKLPDSEQQTLRAFWAEVESLRVKADAGK